MRDSIVAAAAVGIGTVLLTGMGPAASQGRHLTATLSGANEFNAAGQPTNPHGNADRAVATLRFHPATETVCWSVQRFSLADGDALPTAAHVHDAPRGVPGGVVVELFRGATAPTSYPAGPTCVPAAKDVIRQILARPGQYYVNLHNAQHPSGAMRGQLHR